MAQYQSFPDAPGDSRTYEKLKALKFPQLEGRSFLDVGCNEGFFCGFAEFAGARRVVGLDKSRLFIERARRRFPPCEFVLGDWDALPEGPFDVVLLASAIHYADDQPGLIRRLVDLLSHDGVLILEMGVVTSSSSEWRKVRRGDDHRMFPSMPKVEEVLAPYAWKWMGPSVDQAGDPVKRQVFHIMRRRPMAYLLMEPPGYGKTTISKALFRDGAVTRVSGDELILHIARGQRSAPERLRLLLERGFSPFRIDESIRMVFEGGQGDALVQELVKSAGEGDFALDMYVPDSCQEAVEVRLRDLGFLPVRLTWERVAPPSHESGTTADLASAFLEQLAKSTRVATSETRQGAGYVDTVDVAEGRVVMTGWAVDGKRERGPDWIFLEMGSQRLRGAVTPVDRPDVKRRMGLEHGRFGWRTEIKIERPVAVAELIQQAQVFATWGSVGKVLLAWSTLLLTRMGEKS